jgi:hypothetical protein
LKTLPTIVSVEIPNETEDCYQLFDLRQTPKGTYLKIGTEEELELEISKLKSKYEADILPYASEKFQQLVKNKKITLQQSIDKVTKRHDLKYAIVMQHNWYPEVKAMKARYDSIRS